MKMQIPAKYRTQITLAQLPDGVKGIRATLALMVDLVRQSKSDFYIRNRALQLVSGVQQKNYLGEIKAIHEFVRDSIRYVRDINGVETVATASNTLQMGQGDCDDKSVLTAALLEAIGHPTRFVAVGRVPGQFEHVLVETQMYVNGGKQVWIPVETTEPVPVGWYPANMTQRLVYHV
jgi:hypothetical protein